MNEKIFSRIEKKYLITSKEQTALLKLIKKHMKKDNYFDSEIYNIYFDTENYDLIIQSIDHPVFKEKLRARSYGGYDKVFIEIKTKIRGLAYRKDLLEDDDIVKDNNLSYKRRVLLSHEDYNKLITGEANVKTLAAQLVEKGSDAQIAKEIDYMIEHFNLKPRILLYYNRESYVNEDRLRVTFDTDVHYRDQDLEFTKKSNDQILLNDDKNIIMEIKAHGAMPLWLVRHLSTAHIYPTQFSKIGKAYELIRKEKNV
jgi:SPX domain protein involved in polyphosphate accumulation